MLHNATSSTLTGSRLRLLNMRLGERIQQLRSARGENQQALARAIGITRSAISQLESGLTHGLKPDNLVAAARHFGLSVEELLHGNDSSPRLIVEQPEPLYATHRHCPVVGTVQAGDDGFWDELQYPAGTGDGLVRYPTNDPNGYALRVKGDSMRPRIKPGEFIIVEPNSPLIPGEEVIVTTTNGRSMVKILGPRRNGTIELHSINEDHRPITIDEGDVRAIHYVAAICKPSMYYENM